MNIVPEKHLVFLSYYFPPMGGGGVQRILKFLKYWDYQKYKISVITVKSSFFYAEDPVLIHELPPTVRVIRTGSMDPFRLLSIFRKILRFSPDAANNKHESGEILRRISAYLFLPDSRLFWLPFALWRLFRLKQQQKIDLVVATMPPFTSGLIARLAASLLKLPYLLDFRDAWTHNPYLPVVSRMHELLQTWLEELTVKKASALIFVNPNLRRYYQKKYRLENSTPNITVRNGFDPDDFRLPSIPWRRENSEFRLGVIGTVYSQGNAPETLLRAAKKLPDTGRRLKIVFIGKWARNFMQTVRDLEVNNLVEMIPYLPHREALQAAGQMDALALAIQSNYPGSENVIPGRIYEYLALKKPVLAMCPAKSELVKIIRECDAGEAVEYDDVKAIKAVLLGWLQNSHSYQFKNIVQFNRKRLTDQFIDFLDTEIF